MLASITQWSVLKEKRYAVLRGVLLHNTSQLRIELREEFRISKWSRVFHRLTILSQTTGSQKGS